MFQPTPSCICVGKKCHESAVQHCWTNLSVKAFHALSSWARDIQSLPAHSVLVSTKCSIESRHLVFGRPLGLCPGKELQCKILLDHLESILLAACPAHVHFLLLCPATQSSKRVCFNFFLLRFPLPSSHNPPSLKIYSVCVYMYVYMYIYSY